MFIGSLVLVPWLVLQIPHDYFLGMTRAEHRPRFRHPGRRLAALVAKNLLGGILLTAGLAMIFLPGQGLLTLFMGIMLIDFPGKFRLEKRIVCTPVILRSLNWIRVKRNRPPIQAPGGNRGSGIRDP
jgi:hypothetical protein